MTSTSTRMFLRRDYYPYTFFFLFPFDPAALGVVSLEPGPDLSSSMGRFFKVSTSAPNLHITLLLLYLPCP